MYMYSKVPNRAWAYSRGGPIIKGIRYGGLIVEVGLLSREYGNMVYKVCNIFLLL